MLLKLLPDGTAGAGKNQEIRTCAIFKIIECEDIEEALKMQSFLASQTFYTTILMTKPPRKAMGRTKSNPAISRPSKHPPSNVEEQAI